MTAFSYVEGLTHLSINDGVVKVELAALASNESNGGPQVEVVPDVRLAISLPGFLKIYAQMSGVIGQLVEKGVLKKSDGEVMGMETAIQNKSASDVSAQAI